ncbi:unnamed protein product [Nippostrongylus brasiliensis]|uniref:Ovule protein n=1 Tax=Nippostrongylus brasiliensis TaxID=27835 RepID=A0A0N4XJ25_NIPBR|nr:unnamed protein product [Nippostrongylus brasiliensis]
MISRWTVVVGGLAVVLLRKLRSFVITTLYTLVHVPLNAIMTPVLLLFSNGITNNFEDVMSKNAVHDVAPVGCGFIHLKCSFLLLFAYFLLIVTSG